MLNTINQSIIIVTLLLYGLLSVASISVFLKQRTLKSQLIEQINAWWVIFPVVTGCLLLNGGATLLVLIISGFVIRELSTLGNEVLTKAPGEQRWRSQNFILKCLISLGLAVFLSYYLFAASVLLPIFLVAIGLLLYLRRSALFMFVVFITACVGLNFITLIERAEGIESLHWLFYLLVITALNDISQFISGSLFGQHRIAKNISPNKTWQGLIGGLIISIIVSLGLGFYLQVAPLYHLIQLGIMLSIGGFLGDLLFSLVKRKLQVKDFSSLIRGHGGMLDRADSLVFTAPLLYVYLVLFRVS